MNFIGHKTSKLASSQVNDSTIKKLKKIEKNYTHTKYTIKLESGIFQQTKLSHFSRIMK